MSRLLVPCWLLAVLLCLGMSAAMAQEQAQAEQPPLQQVLLASGVDGHQSHAWSVYRNSADEIILAHIPPRDGDSSGEIIIQPGEPGQLQAMRPLGLKFPLGLAAIEDRVYMIFPKAFTNTRQIMRVYSGRAVPSPVGSMWNFLPPDRLNTEHAIETHGTLLGFTATQDTLWTLIDEEDGPVLRRLTETGWKTVDLPAGDSESDPSWMMSAIGEELVLLDRDSDPLVALVRDVEIGSWVARGWEPLPRPQGRFVLLPGHRGITVLQWGPQDMATVRSWMRSGLFTLAADLDLPSDAQYTVLDSTNALLAMRGEPNADSQEPTPPTVKLWEIDLADGSVVYEGPPVAQMPVSVNEFRFLVGMMILVMMGVLVVVIMPDGPDAMRIPEGYALSEPGRRLIATLIDVGLVVLLMGELFGVSAQEILTLEVILRSDNAWVVIPVTMVSGLVIMTVFERFLGATPGKLILGLRVVRAQPGPMQRPPLWAAAVRNVVKWILPPVAALALVDPEMLHRGDRASRTVVARPIRTLPGTGEPGESGDDPR
ncbi:MAG: RDD family protein [Phycisphaerales bacterium]